VALPSTSGSPLGSGNLRFQLAHVKHANLPALQAEDAPLPVPPAVTMVTVTPSGLVKEFMQSPVKHVRAYCPTVTGLPRIRGGSAPAPAVSRHAQRSLTSQPARSPSHHGDPVY
jgi:hypothetical protein